MDILETHLQGIEILPDTVYVKCEATPAEGKRLSKSTFMNISLTTLLKDFQIHAMCSVGTNASSARIEKFLSDFLLTQPEYKEG